MASKVQMNVRIDPELKRRLIAEAEERRWPLGALVAEWLQMGLQAYGVAIRREQGQTDVSKETDPRTAR